MDKPKILWNIECYNYQPFNGIALYNGKYVYFERSFKGEWYYVKPNEIEHLDPDIYNIGDIQFEMGKNASEIICEKYTRYRYMNYLKNIFYNLKTIINYFKNLLDFIQIMILMFINHLI